MKQSTKTLLFYLTQVMFTAGLALLVPAAYAYHCKQEAYKQILVSCALLMLPALPHALETTARGTWNAATRLFKAPASSANPLIIKSEIWLCLWHHTFSAIFNVS